MSANTDRNEGLEYVSVGALLLLEAEGAPEIWMQSPNMLAQAQVALNEGVPLDEVLDNPKRYAAQVWPMASSVRQNRKPGVEDDEGMDFGTYRLRQPTGRDMIFSQREGPYMSWVRCFARCADMPLEEVKALELPDYYRGEQWLGEELGVFIPTPSPS